jgi:hypothetical protein
MSGGTHGDAGVAVEKYVSVDVLDPDSAAAFGDELERRARVGGVYEFGVGFDDLLAVWSRQRGLYFRAPGWCDYAGRHLLNSLVFGSFCGTGDNDYKRKLSVSTT